jgi:hypothetical protein
MAEERSQMATGPAIIGGIAILAGLLFYIIFLGQGAEKANHMTGWLPGSSTHLWP